MEDLFDSIGEVIKDILKTIFGSDEEEKEEEEDED